eukprot:gene3456-2407_t
MCAKLLPTAIIHNLKPNSSKSHTHRKPTLGNPMYTKPTINPKFTKTTNSRPKAHYCSNCQLYYTNLPSRKHLRQFCSIKIPIKPPPQG